MRGPKVVLVGAGSLYFGRQFIQAMTSQAVFQNGTMALVDIDEQRLDKMMRLAELAIDHTGCRVSLEGSTDHRDVLTDADFVILSFAYEGIRYREIDCRIAAKYGVLMCSGDTIGPGGIFRAMRELPVILQIAEDVKRLCPDAWVVNYINPTAVNGIGLMRHTGIKSFALCDALHMPYVKRQYLKAVGGVDLAKLKLTIAGVNHCTWLLDITYEGKDVSGQLRQTLETEAMDEKDNDHSKARFNKTCGLMLWDIFGRWPMCMGHTKEYVPFWQGRGVLPDHPGSLRVFDAASRIRKHEAMWEEVSAFITRERDITEFFRLYETDHAMDIIEAMWTNSGNAFFINVPNAGAVSNLHDDAFLELLCDVDMNGPVPRPVGEFPVGLRSLQMQVLDTHELTVEAIIKSDRALLRRAMLVDPIVNSISDADAVIEELLAAETAVLPHW